MLKKIFVLLILTVSVFSLVACKDKKPSGKINFIDKKVVSPIITKKTNDESISDLVIIYSDETASDIKVLPVELRDDFIIGVDMSSIIAVEAAGGVFYNNLGEEQDVFEILKEHGVNHVRIRLWNNPYNASFVGFGGGTNDTETGILIAKRASDVGMGITLDFHYSDFWADPGKQTMPRLWNELNNLELKQAIYEYTFNTINAFKDEGVTPDRKSNV